MGDFCVVATPPMLTKEERIAKLVTDMRERQAKRDARAGRAVAFKVEREKRFRAKQQILMQKARSKKMREVRKAVKKQNRAMQSVDPPPFRLPPPPDGMDVLPDPEKEPETPVRWDDRHVFAARVDSLKPDAFMEKIARQPGFIEAMQENTKDPRVAKFLKKCGEIQNKSLTWIAKSCGLTTIDLARIWRDDKLAHAFFEIVNRMPENAAKVMDDSLGDRKSCPRCDGLKCIEVPEKFREFFFEPDSKETMAMCPECGGKGWKVSVGSAAHNQMIWEKVGWTKQKGGISVNVNMADHSVDSVIDEMDDFEQPQIVEHQN